MEYISKTEADTYRIGEFLAQKANKGDIFLLYGTLGMGKSVLARGFIQELCGEDIEVPSPTFTLVQSYPTPAFNIYHFDLYRVKHESEILELGIEDAFYDGVCLIEWPEKLGIYLPSKYTKVEIIALDDDSRRITIEKI